MTLDDVKQQVFNLMVQGRTIESISTEWEVDQSLIKQLIGEHFTNNLWKLKPRISNMEN